MIMKQQYVSTISSFPPFRRRTDPSAFAPKGASVRSLAERRSGGRPYGPIGPEGIGGNSRSFTPHLSPCGGHPPPQGGRKYRSFCPCQLEAFTLVELVIVIAIIGLIAAIATSSALRSRVQANEGAVKGALKTIESASVSFRGANGRYPNSLAELGSDYLGGGLETGRANGYNFTWTAGPNNQTFTVTASPQDAVFTGNNSFCTSAANVIYIYSQANISADGRDCPAGGTVFTG